MTVIKDGTGKGFIAGVTNTNKLEVEAVTTSDGSYTSDSGFGFFTNGTTTITQSEKTVVIIVNTGTNTYEIGRVWISVQNQQPLSTTSSTITTIKFYIGTATATLGTIKTPANANTGSLNTAFITVRSDNPTIAGTDSEIKQLYFLEDDSQLVDFEGSIILEPTGSFRVTCTGGAGITSGTLLCATNVQIFKEI